MTSLSVEMRVECMLHTPLYVSLCLSLFSLLSVYVYVRVHRRDKSMRRALREKPAARIETGITSERERARERGGGGPFFRLLFIVPDIFRNAIASSLPRGRLYSRDKSQDVTKIQFASYKSSQRDPVNSITDTLLPKLDIPRALA